MSTKKGGSKPTRHVRKCHSAAGTRLVFQECAECSVARRGAALCAMGRVPTAGPGSLEGTLSDGSEGDLPPFPSRQLLALSSELGAVSKLCFFAKISPFFVLALIIAIREKLC